jgi:hypothetical protein
MLFPFNWVYFLFEPDSARGFVAIARLWVSAIAMYCLLCKHELSPSAAFIGGAVWVFASFNMHWLAWPHSNASLWLPVLILAIDYLLIDPRLKMLAWTALTAGPLFLAGHPGTAYIAGLVAGFYSLCRVISLRATGLSWRSLLNRLALLGLAMVLGVGLAAAALLPMWMQIRQSYDYLDPAGMRGMFAPLDPSALWLLLIPEIFGRNRGAFPISGYLGPDNYIEMTLWFGALALGMTICTLLGALLPGWLFQGRATSRHHRFLVGFATAGFILSMMVVFCVEPINSILTYVPGSTLTNFRRFQMAMNFSGAVLTAVCVHRILKENNRRIGAIASLILLTLSIVVLRHVLIDWTDQQGDLSAGIATLKTKFGNTDAERLIPQMLIQSAVWRIRLGALFLLLGALSLAEMSIAMARGKMVSPAFRILFLGLIVLDVMLPAVEFQPVPPRRLAQPPTPPVLKAAIERAGDGRLLGTAGILAPNLSMHFEFRDIRGYDLPHNLRLVKLLRALKLDDRDCRAIVETARFYPQLDPRMQAYFDRTCVRCVIARVARAIPNPAPDAPVGSTLSVLDEVLFDNPNAYPRTYLARSAVPVADPTRAMQVLLSPGIDLRERSVFEGPGEPEIAPALADESASIITDDPETIVIATQTRSRRLLVLADRMDIGWQVRIDGQPAVALTANYLFRGVFVPPGRHRVEWTYHAPGLRAGIAVSVTTLLLVLAVMVIPRSRLGW